jgi:hypothetical protein
MQRNLLNITSGHPAASSRQIIKKSNASVHRTALKTKP